MGASLFVTATEARSGKSAISLGVMEMLLRRIDKVGFFRPIINVDPDSEKKDDDINLIASYFDLDIPYRQMYGYTAQEAANLIAQGREEALLEGIIERYNQLARQYDFVLCEGTDFASSTSAFELDINAEISKNLGAPVLLVANAYKKAVDDTVQAIEMAHDSLDEKGCKIAAIVVNRPSSEEKQSIIDRLRADDLIRDHLVYAIPDEAFLGKPTIGEIAHAIGADVLWGEDQLQRHAYNFVVAAMHLPNVLERIEYGSLILTPGDRSDVIVGCLASVVSHTTEYISGILLSGGLQPDESIWKLIKGSPRMVPILSIQDNTFPSAMKVSNVHSKIAPEDERKIARVLEMFEKHVNINELSEYVVTTRTDFVTPKMFEYEIQQRAKVHKQHIVLPEGEEERILRAAEILLRREIVDITLLGDEQVIRGKINDLELQMSGIKIVEPRQSKWFEEYVQTYYELRKHKGCTPEHAHDVICDVSFFGAMMVYKRHADGMVSGSVHSTADTVRPALKIIKTKPGTSIVSSVFFMCLDKILVYGDCAVNTNPNAAQLAEIAITSSTTAKSFGVDPMVAMLSYSSGKSGHGEDVDKVREATKLAKEMADTIYPGLKIEGPMQYDTAVDPATAKTKMPDSEVAGKATVFIFPDLNTGNNTYKAVQRSAGVIAVGPVLQGLKFPVNDLSRGCTVPDVVNTVVITAIQAQDGKGL